MGTRPRLLAGADLPPAPRQRRSQKKRGLLKAAALDLFGANGYEGTSVEQIVERAGLALGTFYQHFRSKKQLLLALMDDLLEALAGLNLELPQAGGVREALHNFLRRAFSSDLRYLGAYRAWQEAVLSDPDLARKEKRIRDWTLQRVVAMLRQMQQLPGARRGLDVPALGRLLDGFFWSLLGQAPGMTRQELVRSVEGATHLVYHALFIDPRKKGILR